MMRLLIDTNRYTDLIRGEPEVLKAASEATQLFLSFIVLAELHAGFRMGSRRVHNEQRLKEFLSQPGVGIFYADAQTVVVYADMKVQLRRQGTPIPDHDIWIAALALQHGLTLYSRDKHVDHLPQVARM